MLRHKRMLRHNATRALWRHLIRGLLIYGACVGGSPLSYAEWARNKPGEPLSADHWDWSTPHRWYDTAHRL